MAHISQKLSSVRRSSDAARKDTSDVLHTPFFWTGLLAGIFFVLSISLFSRLVPRVYAVTTGVCAVSSSERTLEDEDISALAAAAPFLSFNELSSWGEKGYSKDQIRNRIRPVFGWLPNSVTEWLVNTIVQRGKDTVVSETPDGEAMATTPNPNATASFDHQTLLPKPVSIGVRLLAIYPNMTEKDMKTGMELYALFVKNHADRITGYPTGTTLEEFIQTNMFNTYMDNPMQFSSQEVYRSIRSSLEHIVYQTMLLRSQSTIKGGTYMSESDQQLLEALLPDLAVTAEGLEQTFVKVVDQENIEKVHDRNAAAFFTEMVRVEGEIGYSIETRFSRWVTGLFVDDETHFFGGSVWKDDYVHVALFGEGFQERLLARYREERDQSTLPETEFLHQFQAKIREEYALYIERQMYRAGRLAETKVNPQASVVDENRNITAWIAFSNSPFFAFVRTVFAAVCTILVLIAVMVAYNIATTHFEALGTQPGIIARFLFDRYTQVLQSTAIFSFALQIFTGLFFSVTYTNNMSYFSWVLPNYHANVFEIEEKRVSQETFDAYMEAHGVTTANDIQHARYLYIKYMARYSGRRKHSELADAKRWLAGEVGDNDLPSRATVAAAVRGFISDTYLIDGYETNEKMPVAQISAWHTIGTFIESFRISLVGYWNQSIVAIRYHWMRILYTPIAALEELAAPGVSPYVHEWIDEKDREVSADDYLKRQLWEVVNTADGSIDAVGVIHKHREIESAILTIESALIGDPKTLGARLPKLSDYERQTNIIYMIDRIQSLHGGRRYTDIVQKIANNELLPDEAEYRIRAYIEEVRSLEFTVSYLADHGVLNREEFERDETYIKRMMLVSKQMEIIQSRLGQTAFTGSQRRTVVATIALRHVGEIDPDIFLDAADDPSLFDYGYGDRLLKGYFIDKNHSRVPSDSKGQFAYIFSDDHGRVERTIEVHRYYQDQALKRREALKPYFTWAAVVRKTALVLFGTTLVTGYTPAIGTNVAIFVSAPFVKGVAWVADQYYGFQTAIKMWAQVPTDIPPNTAYRPMSSLLSSAIDRYKNKTHGRVTWNKQPGYISSEVLAQNIQQQEELQGFFRNPIETFNSFQKRDEFGALEALWVSVIGENSPVYPLVQESRDDVTSMLDFASSNIPSGIGRQRAPMNDAGMSETSKGRVALAYMADISSHIMQVSKEAGGPVSAEEILLYTLEKNDGDLDKALWDTALFLRFAARNLNAQGTYIGMLDDANRGEVGAWLGTYILDEFTTGGGPSYNVLFSKIPQDSGYWACDHCEKVLDPIAQSGIYHYFTSVAMLDALDPTIVGGSLAGLELGVDAERLGTSRIASEMEFSQHLADINSLLGEFEDGAQPIDSEATQEKITWVDGADEFGKSLISYVYMNHRAQFLDWVKGNISISLPDGRSIGVLNKRFSTHEGILNLVIMPASLHSHWNDIQHLGIGSYTVGGKKVIFDYDSAAVVKEFTETYGIALRSPGFTVDAIFPDLMPEKAILLEADRVTDYERKLGLVMNASEGTSVQNTLIGTTSIGEFSTYLNTNVQPQYLPDSWTDPQSLLVTFDGENETLQFGRRVGISKNGKFLVFVGMDAYGNPVLDPHKRDTINRISVFEMDSLGSLEIVNKIVTHLSADHTENTAFQMALASLGSRPQPHAYSLPNGAIESEYGVYVIGSIYKTTDVRISSAYVTVPGGNAITRKADGIIDIAPSTNDMLVYGYILTYADGSTVVVTDFEGDFRELPAALADHQISVWKHNPSAVADVDGRSMLGIGNEKLDSIIRTLGISVEKPINDDSWSSNGHVAFRDSNGNPWLLVTVYRDTDQDREETVTVGGKTVQLVVSGGYDIAYRYSETPDLVSAIPISDAVYDAMQKAEEDGVGGFFARQIALVGEFSDFDNFNSYAAEETYTVANQELDAFFKSQVNGWVSVAEQKTTDASDLGTDQGISIRNLIESGRYWDVPIITWNGVVYTITPVDGHPDRVYVTQTRIGNSNSRVEEQKYSVRPSPNSARVNSFIEFTYQPTADTLPVTMLMNKELRPLQVFTGTYGSLDELQSSWFSMQTHDFPYAAGVEQRTYDAWINDNTERIVPLGLIGSGDSYTEMYAAITVDKETGRGTVVFIGPSYESWLQDGFEEHVRAELQMLRSENLLTMHSKVPDDSSIPNAQFVRNNTAIMRIGMPGEIAADREIIRRYFGDDAFAEMSEKHFAVLRDDSIVVERAVQGGYEYVRVNNSSMMKYIRDIGLTPFVMNSLQFDREYGRLDRHMGGKVATEKATEFLGMLGIHDSIHLTALPASKNHYVLYETDTAGKRTGRGYDLRIEENGADGNYTIWLQELTLWDIARDSENKEIIQVELTHPIDIQALYEHFGSSVFNNFSTSTGPELYETEKPQSSESTSCTAAVSFRFFGLVFAAGSSCTFTPKVRYDGHQIDGQGRIGEKKAVPFPDGKIRWWTVAHPELTIKPGSDADVQTYGTGTGKDVVPKVGAGQSIVVGKENGPPVVIYHAEEVGVEGNTEPQNTQRTIHNPNAIFNWRKDIDFVMTLDRDAIEQDLIESAVAAGVPESRARRVAESLQIYTDETDFSSHYAQPGRFSPWRWPEWIVGLAIHTRFGTDIFHWGNSQIVAGLREFFPWFGKPAWFLDTSKIYEENDQASNLKTRDAMTAQIEREWLATKSYLIRSMSLPTAIQDTLQFGTLLSIRTLLPFSQNILMLIDAWHPNMYIQQMMKTLSPMVITYFANNATILNVFYDLTSAHRAAERAVEEAPVSVAKTELTSTDVVEPYTLEDPVEKSAPLSLSIFSSVIGMALGFSIIFGFASFLRWLGLDTYMPSVYWFVGVFSYVLINVTSVVGVRWFLEPFFSREITSSQHQNEEVTAAIDPCSSGMTFHIFGQVFAIGETCAFTPGKSYKGQKVEKGKRVGKKEDKMPVPRSGSWWVVDRETLQPTGDKKEHAYTEQDTSTHPTIAAGQSVIVSETRQVTEGTVYDAGDVGIQGDTSENQGKATNEVRIDQSTHPIQDPIQRLGSFALYDDLFEQVLANVPADQNLSPAVLTSCQNVVRPQFADFMNRIGESVRQQAMSNGANPTYVDSRAFDQMVYGYYLEILPNQLIATPEEKILFTSVLKTIRAYYSSHWNPTAWIVPDNTKRIDPKTLQSLFDTITVGNGFYMAPVGVTYGTKIRHATNLLPMQSHISLADGSSDIEAIKKKFNLYKVSRRTDVAGTSGRTVWYGETLDFKQVVILIDNNSFTNTNYTANNYLDQVIRLLFPNTRAIVPMIAFGDFVDINQDKIFTILERVPDDDLLTSQRQITDQTPQERIDHAFGAIREYIALLFQFKEPIQTELFGSVHIYPSDIRTKNMGVTSDGRLRLFDFNTWGVYPAVDAQSTQFDRLTTYTHARQWSAFMEFFFTQNARVSTLMSPFNAIMNRFDIPLRLYPEDGGSMRIIADHPLSGNAEIMRFQQEWNRTFAGRIGYEFDPNLHQTYGNTRYSRLFVSTPVLYLPPDILSAGTFSERFMHRLQHVLDISPTAVLQTIDTLNSSNTHNRQPTEAVSDCSSGMTFHLFGQVFAIGETCAFTPGKSYKGQEIKNGQKVGGKIRHILPKEGSWRVVHPETYTAADTVIHTYGTGTTREDTPRIKDGQSILVGVVGTLNGLPNGPPDDGIVYAAEDVLHPQKTSVFQIFSTIRTSRVGTFIQHVIQKGYEGFKNIKAANEYLTIYGMHIPQLTTTQRERIKQSGIPYKAFVIELPDGRIYSEKEQWFTFTSIRDVTRELKLLVLLTEKGFFHPATTWFYYQNEDGAYHIGAFMPKLDKSARIPKPSIHSSDALEQVIKRLYPEFSIQVKKTDPRYTENIFWLDLLEMDALDQPSNWADDGQRAYLIDIEGITNNPQKALAAVQKLEKNSHVVLNQTNEQDTLVYQGLFSTVFGSSIYALGEVISRLSVPKLGFPASWQPYVSGGYPAFIAALSKWIGPFATFDPNFWRWSFNWVGAGMITMTLLFAALRNTAKGHWYGKKALLYYFLSQTLSFIFIKIIWSGSNTYTTIFDFGDWLAHVGGGVIFILGGFLFQTLQSKGWSIWEGIQVVVRWIWNSLRSSKIAKVILGIVFAIVMITSVVRSVLTNTNILQRQPQQSSEIRTLPEGTTNNFNETPCSSGVSFHFLGQVFAIGEICTLQPGGKTLGYAGTDPNLTVIDIPSIGWWKRIVGGQSGGTFFGVLIGSKPHVSAGEKIEIGPLGGQKTATIDGDDVVNNAEKFKRSPARNLTIDAQRQQMKGIPSAFDSIVVRLKGALFHGATWELPAALPYDPTRVLIHADGVREMATHIPPDQLGMRSYVMSRAQKSGITLTDAQADAIVHTVMDLGAQLHELGNFYSMDHGQPTVRTVYTYDGAEGEAEKIARYYLATDIWYKNFAVSEYLHHVDLEVNTVWGLITDLTAEAILQTNVSPKNFGGFGLPNVVGDRSPLGLGLSIGDVTSNMSSVYNYDDPARNPSILFMAEALMLTGTFPNGYAFSSWFEFVDSFTTKSPLIEEVFASMEAAGVRIAGQPIRDRVKLAKEQPKKLRGIIAAYFQEHPPGIGQPAEPTPENFAAIVSYMIATYGDQMPENGRRVLGPTHEPMISLTRYLRDTNKARPVKPLSVFETSSLDIKVVLIARRSKVGRWSMVRGTELSADIPVLIDGQGPLNVLQEVSIRDNSIIEVSGIMYRVTIQGDTISITREDDATPKPPRGGRSGSPPGSTASTKKTGGTRRDSPSDHTSATFWLPFVEWIRARFTAAGVPCPI